MSSLFIQGFASYSEVCWFQQSNLFVTVVFDVETCSPYMYAGTEWISFENERSLECKVKFIKSNNYGGAMVFSLNTDDTTSTCLQHFHKKETKFPLVQKVNSILFNWKLWLRNKDEKAIKLLKLNYITRTKNIRKLLWQIRLLIFKSI